MSVLETSASLIQPSLALLLMAVYSMRDSQAPSVWYLSGVIIRLCVGMGLHRRLSPMRVTSVYNGEMRKRVFWSAYIIDRMMALSLGRPPGISDDDIDIELPQNTSCVDTRVQRTSSGSTSMSSAIHHIKL